MLKCHSRAAGYKYCSMIGGCESIRDIQESLVIDADALECPAIETTFAMQKLSSSISRFAEQYNLGKMLVFINIGTSEGLDLLKSGRMSGATWPIKKEHVVFMIDRRMLASERTKASDNNFEVSEEESEINELIDLSIESAIQYGHPYGIGGGMTPESLKNLQQIKNRPTYLKSGLFTFKADWESPLQNIARLKCLQRQELDLLMRMHNILTSQTRDIKHRCDHLYAYLTED